MLKPLNEFLAEVDQREWMISSSARDYPQDCYIEPHSHAKHQLIYAIAGVMVVHAQRHQWLVPPNRGIWMPKGHSHSIRCVGCVKMRSVFIRADRPLQVPAVPRAVSISALLSELIKASIDIRPPFPTHSREARIMDLIVDELEILPPLPLSLPQPEDPRIALICSAMQARPGDNSTLLRWSQRLQLDAKTIQRLFQRETGMRFAQWRQQARLLLALERLAQGEKIIEIAGTLGYDSPSAFTHMFKKQFGKTPSQFFK
jgi:AraC-like DNA-binding protein